MERLSAETIVKVSNRDNGRVGYAIPELNGLVRQFMPGETKELDMNELRKLTYQPGGRYMLKNLLMVDNESAVAELLGEVEPEYYYGREEIRRVLLTGSLDELADTLQFAPKGRIELLKEVAIEEKLNDINKREMILEMTGINLSNIIDNNEYANSAEEAPAKAERRVKPAAAEAGPVRRTEAPAKYKVIE